MSSKSLIEIIQTLPKSSLFSKNDPLDPRMGDIFKCFNNSSQAWPESHFLILGYKDDRGIKNNSGREGARFGPDGIRQYFYKLTTSTLEKEVFLDLGNWDSLATSDLLNFHNDLKTEIKTLHHKNNFLISLGGGHDYAYPDGHGFVASQLSENPKLKPLIINFDAHLDVRSDEKGVNSGTAFYKLLKEFHNQIDFYEVGIQSHCNSDYHRHFVENHFGKIISLEDIRQHSLAFHLDEIFKRHSEQPLFVSLDIDVLNASEAPGCSQSWPLGLSFQELYSSFTQLSLFKKWRQLGIYEVSPPLDFNGNTQRAAALFMYRYFQYFKEYHYDLR